MQQTKKIPLRRCVGCGEHFPKSALARIVRTPEGAIAFDRTGKMNGRGVYLCPRRACLNKARKARRVEAGLCCAIPDEIYSALEGELTDDAIG